MIMMMVMVMMIHDPILFDLVAMCSIRNDSKANWTCLLGVEVV